MKIELFPEDVLIEYVEKLLGGEENPKLSASRYFEHFPRLLEPSEDFAKRWQNMVEPVVKKFISDTFSLHQFLFDTDGYVKKFCVTDAEFWQNIDLKFSHRCAQRLYEHMLARNADESPLYLITTPADALFISIVIANFNEYSYPWFEKNGGSWVVAALFIAWQPVHANNIPWKSCFDAPKGVALPVRGYLLERAAVYFSCVNHLIRNEMETIRTGESDFLKLASERSGAGLPMNFIRSSTVGEIVRAGRDLAKSIRSAVDYWCGEGTIAFDDDRFIKGLFNTSGLAEEINEFEAVVKEYTETRGLEERINESIIFN